LPMAKNAAQPHAHFVLVNLVGKTLQHRADLKTSLGKR